jgi:hypothetical protein
MVFLDYVDWPRTGGPFWVSPAAFQLGAAGLFLSDWRIASLRSPEAQVLMASCCSLSGATVRN